MKKMFTRILLLSLLVGSVVVNGLPLFNNVAATTVESDITEDVVWTVANSPYLLSNNISVRKGATLAIEPGVVVTLDENVMLSVEGTLLANGNSDERIVFELNPLVIGKPGAPEVHWTGLRFAGENTDLFKLQFVEIRNSKNGVTIESLGIVEIENSEMANNMLSGIHIIGQANVVVQNNVIQSNEHGVSAIGNISSNIEVARNHISDNTHGIYVHTTDENVSRIHSLTISDNVLQHNAYGIRLHAEGGYEGYICNSSITNNTVRFNERGIDIKSQRNAFSWISNVTLSENKVFANENGISLDANRADAPPLGNLSFDSEMIRNIVSANNNTGIEILGDVRVNLTDNSVSYNSYGISIDSQDNWARRNDIYQNSLYGMYVNNGATINATYNYWGDASGPYHENLNPAGQGDHVNGNGTTLDFDPFLETPVGYINHPPVAKLTILEANVLVNQTVSMNASDSTDDTVIMNYLFEFGDGETKWVFPGVVTHRYSSSGLYNVSVVAMDEFGVKSSNEMIETVNVTLPVLVIDVLLKPPTVISKDRALVEVHVTNGSDAVEGVMIKLESNMGGSFDPASGLTDLGGDFNSTYFSPEVSEDITVAIRVNASQKGYINATEQTFLPVLAARPTEAWFESPLVWTTVVAATVVVATAIFIFKRRRNRAKAGSG